VRVLILPDAATAARHAAERVAALVAARPRAVLGLATGETMRPFYAALRALHRAGRLDLSGVTAFTLDEYLGVPPDHPASFHAYMRAELFDHVALAAAHLPDGDVPDPEAEAARYEAAIAAAGGIDLQLLGIGRNGHLAFNEPGSAPASRTRVTTLSETTRAANAAAFAPLPVPGRAITLGLGTIMEARACLLIATGASKADAVAAAVEGPVDLACPASVLQRHPGATLLIDRAASAALRWPDRHETLSQGGDEAACG
jgi:glucosamine-6-phosphate deaminase